MPRPTHRSLTIIWRHSLRICSLSLLTFVVTMLYLHNRDVDHIHTTSRISNVNDRPLYDWQSERSNSSSKNNFPVEEEYENQKNRIAQRQNENTEEHGDGLKSRGRVDTVHAIRNQLVEHKDIAQQGNDIDRQMVQHKDLTQEISNSDRQIVEHKDIAGQISDIDRQMDQREDIIKQNRDAVQIRHLNEVKMIEKTFTPHEYPFNVNLSDILRQYDTRGYAAEKPINVFDHRYIIHPDQTCIGSDTIKVLFIVKSSPDHNVKRAIIRETWADRKRFPWLRTVFSFGIPKNGKSLLDLQEESTKFNDILLVNYSDDYYNLTLKTMSGLRWAATNCAHASYVVSIDDDIYVAPDFLLSFLDKLPVRTAENLYHGHLIHETAPVRDRNGPFRKWYVSINEYPFQTYPNYIFGGFVIMSMSTVKTFTIAAMYTKLLKFEDVYLGILAARVGIDATDSGHVNAKKTLTVSESFKTAIASHFYQDPYDLKRAWECHLSLISHNTPKSILCDNIGTRLHHLKSEIDSIVNWMESAKKSI
ncbi:beta-1,3-galactosyltransferase 1-like [Pecten maximus]|uniref:beta-1,3-galactosyltransferase 1-like n=1 Tax=Pecten maximus TaxID=6579 RepID=UPI001458FAE8|nr:beta-1,3-galactosyltransferase 1-like [Pecten maximus]